MKHASLFTALRFFLAWPSVSHAADLLIQRHLKIDGDRYEYLAPAAETLSERHPLATTLALCAMIDFTLIKASSKRYGYAAEHLATCAELAGRIEDFGELETQDAYLARLKTQHGRKYGFWSLTEA
jgi:hypothetical protein